MLAARKDFREKLAQPEGKYADQFKIVFEAIAEPMTPAGSPEKVLGSNVTKGE
jgi:hypothetical protein